MPSRSWIKIYCDKWLSGSIRQETPLVRVVMVDLLTLAGSGRYGDTGSIKLADNVGMTNEQVAGILNINLKDWLMAKQRLIETDRITVNGHNIIDIVNWRKYQSEYERQRVYRNPKLQDEVTTESYNGKYNQKCVEKEIEKEIIDNNAHFDIFWNAYPKKKSKGQAEKAFKKLKLDDALLQIILTAIEKAKKSKDWLKNGGEFIPYPATWLNAKGWEDEITDKKPPGAVGADNWPRGL